MWQSANVVRAKTHHRTRRRVRHGHHTRIQSSPHVPQGRKCETKLHAKRKAKRPAGARTGTRTSVTTNEDEPTLDRLTSYDDTLIAAGGNTGTRRERGARARRRCDASPRPRRRRRRRPCTSTAWTLRRVVLSRDVSDVRSTVSASAPGLLPRHLGLPRAAGPRTRPARVGGAGVCAVRTRVFGAYICKRSAVT